MAKKEIKKGLAIDVKFIGIEDLDLLSKVSAAFSKEILKMENDYVAYNFQVEEMQFQILRRGENDFVVKKM